MTGGSARCAAALAEPFADPGPCLVVEPDGLLQAGDGVDQVLPADAGLDRLEVVDPGEGAGEAVIDLRPCSDAEPWQ